MKTTDLFVELVVIGVGAAFWITLLVFTFFGYDWVPFDKALSIPAVLPALAIVYVLGIVSDRMIDILFDWIWGSKFRSQCFPDKREYHEARRKSFARTSAMSSSIEYGRSRLRICRGWSVHSMLIAVTLVIFAFNHLPNRTALGVAVFGFLAFGFLGVTSWFAWRYLNQTQYLKIYEQAQFLDRTTNPASADTK